MAKTINLPDLGENVEKGQVVKLLVNVGDQVAAEQPVLELETGKATVEVPCPAAGIVQEWLVHEGDEVDVGAPVLTLGDEQAGQDAPADSPTGQPEKKPAQPAEEKKQEPAAAPPPEPPRKESPTAAADGGSSKAAGETRKEPPRAPETAPETKAAAPAAGEEEPDKADDAGGGAAPPRLAASPKLRRLAREIGVDLNQIESGSGPDGRLTEEDIKAAARQRPATAQPAPTQSAPASAAGLPDFSAWGPVRREKMETIRRLTAAHMSTSWARIPHVTQCDSADITRLEALRKKYAPQAEQAGGKLTPTAMIAKAVASALKVFPRFNASLDEAGQEIVYKEYIHLGIAVDSPRGLLVPVLRNAARKNMIELAVEIGDLARRAREGKIKPEELEGGTFTLTNLGGIGGSFFTPIINHPEVAILGVGRAEMRPTFREEICKPRLMLPLSLSYDHRVIDGADGARFLHWIVEALEEPLLMALEG